MPRKKPDPPRRRRKGEGGITRLSTGSYRATPPPRLRHLGTRTFRAVAEAEAWLAEILDPSPRAAHLREPLDAYLERWFDIREPGWPEGTRRSYDQALAVLGSHGGIQAVALGELTHEVVRGALARIQRARWMPRPRRPTPAEPQPPAPAPRPYSPRTVAKARTVLRMALADLVPDVLAHNPVDRVRLGRAQRYEGPVYGPSELERFVVAARELGGPLALALELVARRGPRPAEVLRVRWAWIDERRRRLRLLRQGGRRKGAEGDLKGRKARDIPLSDDLLDGFRALKRSAPQLSPFAFAAPDGEPWSYETLRVAAIRAMRHAGLPVIGMRDLRASCATAGLGAGVALPTISRLLGHASTAITAGTYARFLEESLGPAGDSIDAAFEGAADRAPRRLPVPDSGR